MFNFSKFSSIIVLLKRRKNKSVNTFPARKNFDPFQKNLLICDSFDFMAKTTKLSLKKHLDELEKKELVEEVLKLYSKFSQVKEFYQMELSEDTKAFVEGYKKKIKAIYFPARGYGHPRASAIRRLISNFKKVAVFDYAPENVNEISVYRGSITVSAGKMRLKL